MSLRQKQAKRQTPAKLVLPPTPTGALQLHLASPKPPNLRSTPNGKSPLRTAASVTDAGKATALARLKRRELPLIPENKQAQRQQAARRSISPNACSTVQLQQEISQATQFALKSVENFHSKKHSDSSPFRYSPLSTRRSRSPAASPRLPKDSDDSDLSDTSPLSRRKTPTKRDIDGFFRASLKYGDFGCILRKDGLEETWKPPERKSLVLHVEKPRRSEAPLQRHNSSAVAMAQSVLQSLKGQVKPNC